VHWEPNCLRATRLVLCLDGFRLLILRTSDSWDRCIMEKKKDGLIQIRVPCPCHGKVVLSGVKGCDLFLALPSHYKANLHN
jgi:hypothetical protein